MRCTGWIFGVVAVAFILAPVQSEARDNHRSRAPMVKIGKAPASQLRLKTRGISSYRGKAHIKRLSRAGNVKIAKLVLKSMNKRPNRKGIKGSLDRYRKWSAKRIIQKKERQIKVDKFLAKKHAPIPLYLYPMP